MMLGVVDIFDAIFECLGEYICMMSFCEKRIYLVYSFPYPGSTCKKNCSDMIMVVSSQMLRLEAILPRYSFLKWTGLITDLLLK